MFNKIICALAMALALNFTAVSFAADHFDSFNGVLNVNDRHDANFTDLYVFTSNNGIVGDDPVDRKLVMILMLDAWLDDKIDVPQDYSFASDLKIDVYIDNDAAVDQDTDPVIFDPPKILLLGKMGGTILQPNKISEDIVFTVKFDKDGKPRLFSRGIANPEKAVLRYAGLCDEPFNDDSSSPMVPPFTQRVHDNWGLINRAALVIEVPVEEVIDQQTTLLLWATSKVMAGQGNILDSVGRGHYNEALPAGPGTFLVDLDVAAKLNSMHPSKHQKKIGVPPDVLIYNLDRPTAFPNGRSVTDQITDIVIMDTLGHPFDGVPGNDLPLQDGNAAVCPYLSLPHPAAAVVPLDNCTRLHDPVDPRDSTDFGTNCTP